MIRKLTLLAALLATACSSQAADTANLDSVLMTETSGCLEGEVEQFGRYLGDWDIRDWQLSRTDGKTWEEQQGARWNFTCVGNGIAVQDFWMPNAGGFGTNLRIYDAETESWNIAWTATGAPGMTRINAFEDENGNIVMKHVHPPQNPLRKITFFPPTENSWDWQLEMSTDEGKTWNAVYKIKATRR